VRLTPSLCKDRFGPPDGRESDEVVCGMRRSRVDPATEQVS